MPATRSHPDSWPLTVPVAGRQSQAFARHRGIAWALALAAVAIASPGARAGFPGAGGADANGWTGDPPLRDRALAAACRGSAPGDRLPVLIELAIPETEPHTPSTPDPQPEGSGDPSGRGSRDLWRTWQRQLAMQATAVGLLTDPELEPHLLVTASGVGIRARPAAISSLARHPLVIGITLDARVQARQPSVGGRYPQDPLPAGWRRARLRSPSPATLGLLSSGLAPDPALRLESFRDFHSGRALPYDDDGLGTFCATVMAHARDGLSPGARLLVGKVTGPEGETRLSALLSGMDWLASRTQDRPRWVLNGWSLTDPPEDTAARLIYRSLERWNELGMVGIFPSGDRGPGTLDFPGDHPLALSVGGHGAAGSITPWTSRCRVNWNALPYDKPDLLAPGVSVPGRWPGSAPGLLSGSAIAAALVAGLVHASPGSPDEDPRAILRQDLLEPGSDPIPRIRPAGGEPHPLDPPGRG